jgi:hypothetical protein
MEAIVWSVVSEIPTDIAPSLRSAGRAKASVLPSFPSGVFQEGSFLQFSERLS